MDGKMVGFHRLYRSDAPVHLTLQEWSAIEEMNVRTIIDLRSESEQNFAPYIVPERIERISYPLMQNEGQEDDSQALDDKSMAKMAASAFGKSLEDGYQKMVEGHPPRIVSLLELIEEKLKKGAVLYHCTAGKDRTGVLSAVIYLLCGIGDADIIADYQVSSAYQADNPLFDLIPPEMKHLLASKAETMKAFLDTAHARDYLGLLGKYGLSEETVRNLRSELLE